MTGRQHGDGFALIVVIWGLGLIALMCITVAASARWRLAAAANLAGAAQAAQLAEGAQAIAIGALSTDSAGGAGAPVSRFALDGTPVFCSLPQGAVAAIAAEDEGGKVDLNGAPPRLLEAMLKGFGAEGNEAGAITKAIVEFRTVDGPPVASRFGASSVGIAPKHGLFQTIFELDQVAGIDPRLARALYPFVTVSSARAGLDPALAPPALFAALSGAPLEDVRALLVQPYPNRLNRTDPRFSLPFVQGSPGGAILVHVEVVMPAGAGAVREVLVDARRPLGAAVAIKEARHGSPRYLGQLKSLQLASNNALPAC